VRCRGELTGKLELDPGSLAHVEQLDFTRIKGNYEDERSEQDKKYRPVEMSIISVTNLQKILKATPNVRKLSLNNCYFSDEKLELEPGSLASLEEIDLGSTTMSPENLQVILLAAPHLKKITLSRGFDKLTLDTDNIKNLQEFNLFSSDLSFKNLQAILNAPNLMKIQIKDCFVTAHGQEPATS